MAIVIDVEKLTPLELAAVEFMARTAARDEGAAAPTAAEYLQTLVSGALDQWKELYVEQQLPALKPLAARYLSLDDEGRARILAALEELDAGGSAETAPAEPAPAG